MIRRYPTLASIAALAALLSTPALAEDYELSLKGNAFSPKEITIPANQKVKLVVKNLNPAPMEFESHDFNREKVIPGNGQAVIFVGPLAPGAYGFFDEFQENVTGKVIVK